MMTYTRTEIIHSLKSGIAIVVQRGNYKVIRQAFNDARKAKAHYAKDNTNPFQHTIGIDDYPLFASNDNLHKLLLTSLTATNVTSSSPNSNSTSSSSSEQLLIPTLTSTGIHCERCTLITWSVADYNNHNCDKRRKELEEKTRAMIYMLHSLMRELSRIKYAIEEASFWFSQPSNSSASLSFAPPPSSSQPLSHAIPVIVTGHDEYKRVLNGIVSIIDSLLSKSSSPPILSNDDYDTISQYATTMLMRGTRVINNTTTDGAAFSDDIDNSLSGEENDEDDDVAAAEVDDMMNIVVEDIPIPPE
jgi:hypothetical protein